MCGQPKPGPAPGAVDFVRTSPASLLIIIDPKVKLVLYYWRNQLLEYLAVSIGAVGPVGVMSDCLYFSTHLY